ncbi:UNVERIFIED_CONTAM: hypothetical protein GTU68_063855 [Idotea baltica]|nr:hypothetical protein [Idotea baltica]
MNIFQHGAIWPASPTGLTLNVTVIPQLLKPLGYATHAVGKWHLGFCNQKYTPTERGFDSFMGYYTGTEHYFTHINDFKMDEWEISCNQNNASEQYDEQNIPNGYDFYKNKEPYFDVYGNYSTLLFASEVEKILHYSDSSVPKFIYMAFQSVHSPLEVPKNYIKPYAHIKNKPRRIYLGMVTAMDDAIGRIITALKETNHYNNSVIVFTTDNGGSTPIGGNNWPLRGNKSTLWEGGTRGAAFIHSPLLSNSGRTSNNLIHVTDWMATIVSLAGGILPPGTDSIDQWEAIARNKTSPRREMIYNIDEKKSGIQAGIRVGNYKLLVGDPGPGDWTFPPEIRNVHTNDPFPPKIYQKEDNNETYEGDCGFSNLMLGGFETAEELMKSPFRFQLFNVKVDPQERVNLAESKPDILMTLVRRLQTYRDRWVNPHNPPSDSKANPKLWGGVWSPGWC